MPHLLLGGLGEVLADIDTVLPDDPEAVVRAFTQAGGNGGGEAVALLQGWIGSLGAAEAEDVMAALLAVRRHPSDSMDDVDPSLEADLAGSPFDPYLHGWGFRFLCLRYGLVTGSYWLNAELSIPELQATGAVFLEEDTRSLARHLELL